MREFYQSKIARILTMIEDQKYTGLEMSLPDPKDTYIDTLK